MPLTLEAFKENIKMDHFQACTWKAIPLTLEAFKENIKMDHFQACIWKAMPLTLEAFKENIKRAHFRACIWKAALDEEPPNLDLLKFGWVKDDLAKSLCAVPLPQDVPLEPAELLNTIQCMGSSDQPCSSLRYGCVSGQLPCSLFCKCGVSDSCCNQMTKNNMANDANDDGGA